MKYIFFFFLLIGFRIVVAQQTQKPPLHGKHWMAMMGKPLGAESGAQIFQQGGNAVDAACAMLASMCTQWAVLRNTDRWQPLLRVHPAAFVICWQNTVR